METEVESKTYESYRKIFQANQGMLRSSKAIDLGVPKHVVYEMFQKGELIKESRGLYRLKESPPPGNYDLVRVSYLIPKAVICLISALYFYDLTTQIPSGVYIALESHTKRPRVEYPPLRVFYLSSSVLSLGVVEHVVDGVKVRMYSREKTIVDCFKFRNSIGKDIAVEALKDYLRQPHRDIDQIMEFARATRVEKTIRPYLEALV